MIVNPILYQQGTKLPELTNPGAAADLLAGKQLVDQYGNPLTGTMPEVTQATPSISVSSSGLITASAAQDAGHVAAGTKSNTKQLTTQSGKTVTPGTSRQTAVASGRYTTGAVYVAGDANLVAGNIKSGASIFGVAGSVEAKEMCLLTLKNNSSGTALGYYSSGNSNAGRGLSPGESFSVYVLKNSLFSIRLIGISANDSAMDSATNVSRFNIMETTYSGIKDSLCVYQITGNANFNVIK